MIHPLAVVGVSHHTAPVEIRERFAFTASEVEETMARLRTESGVREAVLLSTCNRTEVYLHLASDRDVLRGVHELLRTKAGNGVSESGDYLYETLGEHAARHLFRVSSGLDSMILGEMEIQGQVRDAYEFSASLPLDPPMTGPVLHRLFQMALSVGGRIRSETQLGEGAASIASVSVELARKVFGSFEDRRVLILGAGENSTLVSEALHRMGVRSTVVANRTVERAAELGRRVGGEAVPLDALPEELARCDIIVASTGATEPVLTLDQLRSVHPGGPAKPLLIVDLAIPRDVEASVGDQPNIFLYNVDDLMNIADENLQRRSGALPEAEALIEHQTHAFQAWYASQEVVPLIQSLRERGEKLRALELERLLQRVAHVSEEDLSHLEEFSTRLLNKLLHVPTTRLREGVAEGMGAEFLDIVRFLHGLDVAASDLEEQNADKGRE